MPGGPVILTFGSGGFSIPPTVGLIARRVALAACVRGKGIKLRVNVFLLFLNE
jgi:hypothetical protein